MTSWLGGIGSGLGQSLGQVSGSLSSFTGHISSFTKDMLLEGTEEVPAELNTSNTRFKDLESVYMSQKSEYERLKAIHSELEEKHEAAELQIKQLSSEYRGQLQQKEVEISHLKARQNTLQEQLHKLQASAQSSQTDAPVLPLTSTSTGFLSSEQYNRGFQGDEMDFGDMIWSQQEINRLSNEVVRLEAEVVRWKQLYQTSKYQGSENVDQEEKQSLQRTIKELKEELSREIDEHQHELSVLQDAHRHKLAEVMHRHREELAEYEERIEELEEQIQSGATSGGNPENLKTIDEQHSPIAVEAELVSLRQTNEELKKRIAEMNRLQESAEQQRLAVSEDLRQSQAENCQLIQNYERLQNCVDELQVRVKDQEEKSMQRSLLENENNVLKKALAELENEIASLKSSPQASVTLDDSEMKEMIEMLKKEVKQLEDEKLCFVEQLETLKHQPTSSTEANNEEQTEAFLEIKEQKLQETLTALSCCTLEKETLIAEVEVLDKQNQEATQHLIYLKEQLAQQKQDSDTAVEVLRLELGRSKSEVTRLESELELQKEKLSQSAYALNDMHMTKQQLQQTIQDIKEKLTKAQDSNADIRKENTELKKQLQTTTQQLSEAKHTLLKTNESTSVLQQNQSELEMAKLKQEALESRNSQEKALAENYELKMLTRKLREELERNEDSVTKTLLETNTKLEALKLEKKQLEEELSSAEKRLAEQSKCYQQTIEEITLARNLDATALQAEHERLLKLKQEKEFEITELKSKIDSIEADHQETKEMLASSVCGQKQLTELIKEKDMLMETMKERANELQKELEKNSDTVKDLELLKHQLEDKERQLSTIKEKNSHLKEEIDRMKDHQGRHHSVAEPKTLDIITELETEISHLKAKDSTSQEEMSLMKNTIEEQKANIAQLQNTIQEQEKDMDESKTQREHVTSMYKKVVFDKDKTIISLQETIDEIKKQFQRDVQVIHTDSPVILQEDKCHSINQENGDEKQDLSKAEIDRLVKGIKEKETEINLLNEKNLTLRKQLDQLVDSRTEVSKLSQIIQQKDLEIQALHARVTSGNFMQDVIYLQQQLQAYALEREQVLAVLNEKTRENSQLKSEYHRLMDIVAAKEAALLKLHAENQKMSELRDVGSEDMVRETIQNLSRIIREKDIEIDALTQKSQTLLTVLQSSSSGPGSESSGVSSNQFEELLQERDNLKQQMKKMEEWKQQVITTVKNMQHESAQLQEELLKLQTQVTADSDSNGKLYVDYNRLIQSYEQKERKLGSLSQELAQVQQSISQLSNTKDVLLGKLDLVSVEPKEISSQTSTVLHSAVPLSLDEQLKKLHEEVAIFKNMLEEKETVIRTLQENNHRLSNSFASSSENERKGQEEAAAERKQTKERLDGLQKSLREKDLLIKSKGDQLNSVSESLRNKENDNEVLKQAVTNLKERTLILEMDLRAVKEENEQIMSKSREKETEFRALQETNMQFSMLLREKEFESNSMREKASALERLLKEREQGKSGELNQLLNEVKSMQEKAALFQQERDQVMLALKQKQMEASAVQNELQYLRDKEQRLAQELERLRSHLIEMEESYTREAVAAEDRETELRRKVSVLEEKLVASSSAVENASQQASLQVDSLQEQLNIVVQQRDEALIHLNVSQEQVKQYAVSLSNLQMVLEQFQQEEKAMYSAELEKHKKENSELKRRTEKLEERASNLQARLDEANAALDSASRLTDQLDLKDEQIEELQKQVGLRKEMLEDAQNKLLNLLNNTEGKIDKVLMRNLFVGQFHTPKNKRPEVLRLMGSILGLKKEDMDELLIEEHRGVTGWMTGWLGGRNVQSVPNTPMKGTPASSFNTSFSELFVKFLEVESRPTPPPPKLSVFDIKPLGDAVAGKPSGVRAANLAGTAGADRRTDSNPFLAPCSAAVPLTTTATGSSSTGHLLMKPISDALPTFTPLPVSPDASAGAVLKDLLKE
ncbi:thyroid receptor-interacting protein 11 isoform X1 [Polypterus senegalus]|uniref:thyroid receptor-interacting protein 11 isoform X1 n=1 Tax=Polypterus senegalus TaxID=55291 RepID=UPI0019641AD0|nr:thyroid receptor-interacting protein 11 isoform X1 [Polypterus senegalus]